MAEYGISVRWISFLEHGLSVEKEETLRDDNLENLERWDYYKSFPKIIFTYLSLKNHICQQAEWLICEYTSVSVESLTSGLQMLIEAKKFKIFHACVLYLSGQETEKDRRYCH
jgi:hypothetical protein